MLQLKIFIHAKQLYPNKKSKNKLMRKTKFF